MNWNDFRYVLALQRSGSLASAARLLGVDSTTVSRRLQALEASLGAKLVERGGDGAICLTAKGEAIAAHAASAEQHLGHINQAIAGEAAGIVGTVRLTSVPILVNHVLIPASSALLACHPNLRLELIPDSRDFSLIRREVDLALRFARPKTGGTRVKARRIADVPYGIYAASTVSAPDQNTLPWIGYDDAMAYLPQARWIVAQARRGHETLSGLRVHDGGSAFEAAASGLGKTLVPCVIGKADPRLVAIQPETPEPLTRELWVLGHEDQMTLDRVRVVVDWVDGLFGAGQSGSKAVE